MRSKSRKGAGDCCYDDTLGVPMIAMDVSTLLACHAPMSTGYMNKEEYLGISNRAPFFQWLYKSVNKGNSWKIR